MRPATLADAAAAIPLRLRALADRPAGVTVAELINRFMDAYAGRDAMLRTHLAAWQTLIGDFALEDVDHDLIHAARSELIGMPALAYKGLDHEGRKIFKPKTRQRVKGPATINRYMASLGTLFTWSIEQRMTPRKWVHPCRGVRRMPEPQGRVRFLDANEREKLFASCKAAQYPRLYAMVLMAMVTGARRGELRSLRWADVNLEQGVAQLGHTKNGDRRTLVLLPQVVDALKPFESTDPQRFVFGAVKTAYQTPASIDTAWIEARARASISDFRFHDLRHCCASYLAQDGVPLNIIAEVLGHRKLDMTRRYAHLTTQTKAQAMRGALGGIGL
jgi:integrase